MRFNLLAAAAVAVGLCTGAAWGQKASTVSLRRPAETQEISFEHSGDFDPEYDDDSQDEPLAEESDSTILNQGGNGCCSDGCGNGCGHGGCCLFPCHDLGDPCKLFDCCCLECKKITLGGWINAGYTGNPDASWNGYNGPQTFNDRANEAQVNQIWLYGERATEAGCCWDFGGRFDLMYGTDYRWTTARGLEVDTDFGDKWNGGQRFYGLALPQLYAEAAYDDWKIKMGHFFTPIGYELVNAPGNFFYSHVYTHQYGEPFTHTGVLATLAASEQLALSLGLTRGWDAWDDNNNDAAALGGFTYTTADKFASFAWYFHVGDESDDGLDNRYVNSIVLTLQLSDDLKYVAHHDYGHQENAGVGAGEDAEWYSVTQYMIYTINDCWSAGFRYEFFADDDGFRVAQVLPDDAHTIPIVGVPSHWQDVTVGMNYKPHANVLLRQELRWDWVDPLVDAPDYNGAGGGNGAYDDFTENSQFTVGLDAIVTF